MSGYISNVPLSNQSLGQTQPTINKNFTVLNQDFGTDHVDFTNSAPPAGNGGYHNKTTLVQQSGDPAAVASAPMVYSKLVTYPGALTADEVFVRKASTDGGAVVQLTTLFVPPVSGVVQALGGGGSTTGGTTFLPGGFVLQYGRIASVVNGDTVPFARTFPTACLSVTLTITDPGASTKILNVKSVSQTNFIVNLSSGSISAYYIAIGN